MYKQVIILRKDLNMRKGKMVAQGAHAALNAVLNKAFEPCLVEINDAHGPQILHRRHLCLPLPTPLDRWLKGDHKKITVSVDSEAALLELHAAATAAGLPCSLIKDAGLTEFGGTPTYTAVAIGPALSEAIDPLTRELPLL